MIIFGFTSIYREQYQKLKMIIEKTTMKRILFAGLTLLVMNFGMKAQSDEVAVKSTIMDYIEGTANGDIARIKRAFTNTAAPVSYTHLTLPTILRV